MTKEQFLRKWGWLVLQDEKEILSDLVAVIATEIEKAQEPQPELNPIAEAYERGEKIRYKLWYKDCWIKKHSKTQSIDEKGAISEYDWNIDTDRKEWELYTEPDQVTDQVQPAKPFDKERFEAMFRAVVASGVQQNFECFKIDTTYFLQQLDAYYATKEGGNNEY